MNATAAEIAQGDKVTINYGGRYASHVTVTRTRAFEANGAQYVTVYYRVPHIGSNSILMPAATPVLIVERAA